MKIYYHVADAEYVCPAEERHLFMAELTTTTKAVDAR